MAGDNPHTFSIEQALMITTITSAIEKIKASMNSGPMEFGGERCVLTSEESAVIYRLLKEKLGMRI